MSEEIEVEDWVMPNNWWIEKISYGGKIIITHNRNVENFAEIYYLRDEIVGEERPQMVAENTRGTE